MRVTPSLTVQDQSVIEKWHSPLRYARRFALPAARSAPLLADELPGGSPVFLSSIVLRVRNASADYPAPALTTAEQARFIFDCSGAELTPEYTARLCDSSHRQV